MPLAKQDLLRRIAATANFLFLQTGLKSQSSLAKILRQKILVAAERKAANDFKHASKHRFKAKKAARICAKLSFLRNYLIIWAKPLLFCSKFAKMISQQNYGPLVKWSRRHPLTVESGVRSSYGLPSRHNSNPQQSPAFWQDFSGRLVLKV